MSATVVPLRFQVGARTLLAIPRRLHRIGWTLDDVLARRSPDLSPLGPDADGRLVTSIPDLFVERRFERFERFHFTQGQGQGQDKRQFATGSEPCVDLLLLRATVAPSGLTPSSGCAAAAHAPRPASCTSVPTRSSCRPARTASTASSRAR